MQPRRLMLRWWLLALVLCLALAGCGLAAAAGTTGSRLLGQPATATAVSTAGTTGTPTPATGTASGGQGGASALPDVAGAAERARAATVLVQNLARNVGRGAGMAGGGEVQQGAGSGFIYDPAGYIITNHHVVEGAERLRVVLPDGRAFDARLVGSDPQTDLAVLQIDGDNLPTVPLGTSSALRVGEWVVAIGNALALEGGPTVTAGVVSALNRDVREPGAQAGAAGPTLYGLIQTDAATNPGNSGGPLVNLRGEVVGVNTLGASDAQGIGFAIAIDGAKAIVEQLRRHGRVVRGYVGVTVQSMTPALAAARGLARGDGVLVEQVSPGSPAAQAGLREGDVIVGLNDVPVGSQRDLQAALTNRFKPGDTINVRVNRGGGEQTVGVTLGERPGR